MAAYVCTKPTNIDTYLARAATIHHKLARLQQLDADHFGHDPDAINWGHVGDFSRVEAALDDRLAISKYVFFLFPDFLLSNLENREGRGYWSRRILTLRE